MKYAKIMGVEDKVKFDYQLDLSAFNGKDIPKSTASVTQNKTGGLDGGTLEGLRKRGVSGSVATVAPVPGDKDITDKSDADKGHAVEQLSTSGISKLGNAGTQTKKPIEEGNNNGQKIP